VNTRREEKPARPAAAGGGRADDVARAPAWALSILRVQRSAGNRAAALSVQRGLWGMDRPPNVPQAAPDLSEKVRKFSDPAFAAFQLRTTWAKDGKEAAARLPRAYASEVTAAGPDAERQVLAVFVAEAGKIADEENQTIAEFEKGSRGVLDSMLETSEHKLDDEMRRYGFSEADDGTVTLTPTADMTKLAAAAKELAAADGAVANLQIRLTQSYAAHHRGGPMEEAANREATARDVLGDARYVEAVQNYERLFTARAGTFPILAAYRNDPHGLTALARVVKSPAAAAEAGRPLIEKRRDIATTRKNIASGELSVYGLPNIISAAKAQQALTAGSLKARFVDDRVAKAHHDKAVADLALGAIAAAATVVAVVATAGGAALVAGAATGVGLGVGAVQTLAQIQEFGAAAAAGNTDLDRARAICRQDPSLLWLAVNIAMFVTDVVAAGALLRQVAGPVRKLVVLRQSVGEATPEVVRVFEEEVKPALNALPPGARDRVAAAVEPRAGMSDTVVSLAYDDYLQALGHVFPQRYLDDVARIVDRIGERAAANVAHDPAFVALCRQRRWAQAGTRFHSEAKTVGEQMRAAGEVPASWRFEYTVQSGQGGSRLDVLASGPANQILEFDWKTTGRSALSSKSREEMTRHARQIGVNLNQQLSGQSSVSWTDLVRPRLTTENISWP